jgi:2-amino-4-hydroxy-6-hydroxymethyldihydropteridine diphosphokinase
LDILYADALTVNDEVLTIPHPRLHKRRFVLQPLADIRPSLVLPTMPEPVATLLIHLAGETTLVRHFASSTWLYAP